MIWLVLQDDDPVNRLSSCTHQQAWLRSLGRSDGGSDKASGGSEGAGGGSVEERAQPEEDLRLLARTAPLEGLRNLEVNLQDDHPVNRMIRMDFL